MLCQWVVGPYSGSSQDPLLPGGHEFRRDLTQLLVQVLAGRSQPLERLFGAQPMTLHQNPLGLTDDRPAGYRRLEVGDLDGQHFVVLLYRRARQRRHDGHHLAPCLV